MASLRRWLSLLVLPLLASATACSGTASGHDPGTGGAGPGSAGSGAGPGSGGTGPGSGGDGTGGSGPGSGGSTGTGTGGSGPAPIAGLMIFYSDLESGPNNGGQNDKGAFVTIWGNGFGASQGSSTVTVGGGQVDNYPIWTNTKITFQLGARAATGVISVHVDGKGDSNELPFTVRTGKIYFVSGSGSDSNDGSFAKPFKTIPKAKNTIAAGDIAYLGAAAGESLSQTTEDPTASYNCALGVSKDGNSNSGTAAAPKALVAYPGAKVTIGAESGLQRGLFAPAVGNGFNYWVISQLTLRGEVEALDFSGGAQNWRVIGNDISCPNGTGLSGCVTDSEDNQAPGLKFYGNTVHDAASKVSTITKYYHGIYLSSNNIELAWNTIRDGKTCRAIQIHDSGAPNNYGISIHDNVIHGTVCDGINLATVDPSQGAVVVYNNVIYDVGLGPDPSEGSSIYAGVYVANTTNAGSAGSGTVQVFNNTMYNCGPQGSSSAGAVILASGPVGIQMDNNLIYALTGESYIGRDSGSAPKITGSNNLLFGVSTRPSYLTGTITGDPKLVNAAGHDFHLGAGSAAIDAGKMTNAARDTDGNPRPTGSAFDVGAYEMAN